MKQIRAAIKYLLSFFKSEWAFEDYPLETWSNPNAQQDDIKFRAKFTNWAIFIAHGESVQQAIETLRINLKEYAKENQLPRPGSKVPIQFAGSEKIEQHQEIAIDFFNKIVEIDYFDCFISDFTSLIDFDLDNEETLDKIRNEYGVEANSDLVLSDLFEKIKNRNLD